MSEVSCAEAPKATYLKFGKAVVSAEASVSMLLELQSPEVLNQAMNASES